MTDLETRLRAALTDLDPAIPCPADPLGRVRGRARRIRRRRIALTAVAATVVAAAVGIPVARFTGQPAPIAPAAGRHPSAVPFQQPAPAGLVRTLTSIPVVVTDQVGAGSIRGIPAVFYPPSPLTSHGRPALLWVGALYCPYCAAERWSLVVALSRFGTFTDLGITTSSLSDVYPNTHTLSFYGSSYTSKYLTFVSVEQYTNQPAGRFYKPLQPLTPAEQRLMNRAEGIPSSGGGGSIPFIAVGDYSTSGASFLPALLHGWDWAQIAAAAAHPASQAGRAIDATANWITAAICLTTHNQPASACTPTIHALESRLLDPLAKQLGPPRPGGSAKPSESGS